MAPALAILCVEEAPPSDPPAPAAAAAARVHDSLLEWCRDLLLPAGVLVVSPCGEPTVTAHSKSNGHYPHQIHTKLLEARAQTESLYFSAGPQPK